MICFMIAFTSQQAQVAFEVTLVQDSEARLIERKEILER